MSAKRKAPNALDACAIADYTVYALAEGLAVQTTITDRIDVLGRIATDLGGLATLTGDQIAGWLARPDWSVQTKATYHGHLHAWYRWAVDTGRLQADPMAKLRRPRVPKGLPRPVSDAQLAHALAHAAPPWRLAFTLAAYAGLRAMEIAALRREDVSPSGIRVVKGKGGKDALVPCHTAVWALVEPLPPGPLLNYGGRPLTAHTVSTRATRHLKEIGLAGVGIHRFRHYFGTMIYRNTRDLLVTQQLMRHSSPSTTAGYALLSDDATSAAVAGLLVPGGGA